MTRIEKEVHRARELLRTGQLEGALQVAEALQKEVPENRDVLYLIAVSQRYLGRIADALATLTRFEAIHPDFARLFQERGHCHVAMRDAEPAIDAYQRAVHLNPALPASWRALHTLYRMTGQNESARRAEAEVAALEKTPAEILAASGMYADGELFEAERIARGYLLKHPKHAETMRLLARVAVKLEILDDAEFLFESLLAFSPDHHVARFEYVEVLAKRQRYRQALAEIDALLGRDPGNRALRTLCASIYVGLGRFDEALALYRELREESPENAELHLSIAHVLKTKGEQQAAIESYLAATTINPRYGEAYWSLANLKTYRFSEHATVQMSLAEASPDTGLIDRTHLCFALGKALEDSGNYAESFRFYEKGNRLKKSAGRFQIDVLERMTERLIMTCDREFFRARQGSGSMRNDPIFIVGMPRAGSTLLEQILASHSRVEGTSELAEIPRLASLLQGRNQNDSDLRYPGVLGELSRDLLRRHAEAYLHETQVYRQGRSFFIDKMPNNFRHIGLIHLILPNAKIIDARREAMACCFSNYKQLFASGQEFTYGLDDLARYYRLYVRLMDHWDAVLPGSILRIQHEEVVDDLEANVRKMLDFCGLDFEPACLEFHKTDRSIRTASSEQVRQPIYREGLDQWRRYEPWLRPLKQALSQ